MAYSAIDFKTPTRVMTYTSGDTIAVISAAGYFPVNFIGSAIFVVASNGQAAGIVVASGANSTKLNTV
jgi:hypothetical protein